MLRIGLVLVIFALVALVEWLVYRERAVRWQSYLYVWTAAFSLGCFAALTDQLTYTLSPEYFLYGKGLLRDDWIRLRVAELGFRAGCVGGVVMGFIFLKVERDKIWDRASFRRLGRAIGIVCLAAVVGGAAFAPLSFWVPEPGDEEMVGFGLARRIHLGEYVGAILAALLMAWRVNRQRRT